MWLVKVYEILPKSITYMGDNEWVDCQRLAKRFPSRAEAKKAARELYDRAGVVIVRLKGETDGQAE